MKTLIQIEKSRKEVSIATSQEIKSELGQFLTPYSTALFMSSLFSNLTEANLTLLDPGAGIGSLSSSFIETYRKINRSGILSVDAIELDENLISNLKNNLDSFSDDFIKIQIQNSDFIEECAFGKLWNKKESYTNVILNPPYKKITKHSKYKSLLKTLDLDAVNLYAAFMLLSINQLAENGELVGIIPRSFCNGVYYKKFREFLLRNTIIKRIHLINSRKSAFQDDDVLQENVILHLIKKNSSQVSNYETIVSFSDRIDFSSIEKKYYNLTDIVKNDDFDKIIHIPDSNYNIPNSSIKQYSLSDLKIMVSTGPVVDFRAKDFISNIESKDCLPLIYPAHFSNYSISFPKEQFKKFNYIIKNNQSEKFLFPKGNYVLVKRFSSKEEKKRISASILIEDNFNYPFYGFENHLNVFHSNKKGLDIKLALGLAGYLNSTYVDNYFRQFSGHTQVNASDLRKIPYPSLGVLRRIGIWIEKNIKVLSTDSIDQYLEEILDAE